MLNGGTATEGAEWPPSLDLIFNRSADLLKVHLCYWYTIHSRLTQYL